MDIRNIAIIAHVDHGKTTLVDAMLKQTHTFRDNQAQMQQETILDSNELEREKGITILSKNASVMYKNTKINIIDTPGHADFGGEVERVINMADGALLIVDAAEGPLPQTRFVLEKALERNLPIIVVINKIDRKDSRPQETLSQIEDLFLHIAHHEGHLTFPVLYAIGRLGKTWPEFPENIEEAVSMEALFEAILRHIPSPQGNPNQPFKMLVSSLDFDAHTGTFAIGKVSQGTVAKGQTLLLMDENTKLGQFTVEGVYTSIGLKKSSTARGVTGDIIAISGITGVSIGQTLTDPTDPTGFPAIKLEEPTLKILLSANTSPFSGREGKFCTARQIYERLSREKKTNIGLRIEQNAGGSSFIVAGRGELHLAILLETLRREGYEMQVGKPEVIIRENNGAKEEPYEEITIDIDSQFIGTIVEDLGRRRALMLDTHTNERGGTKMIFKISSRNLLGFRADIMTKTRGNGIFATRFIGYFPLAATAAKSRNGVLISLETGKATGYALTTVQARGKSFIEPGTPIYEGMIIGINNRLEDIEINVCKIKKLTNIHSANADVAIQLDPPVQMSLEQCLDFIEDDELLEITPLSLRLRKRQLSKVNRIRVARADASSKN